MDYITELVGFLKEVSPMVWQTLIKQVYIEAIGYIVWSIGFWVACWFGFKKAKTLDGEDYYDGTLKTVIYIAVGSCVLISLVLLTDGIQHILNPEFYAIRYIISNVTNN